jgi:fructose transport system substrate-binding protein
MTRSRSTQRCTVALGLAVALVVAGCGSSSQSSSPGGGGQAKIGLVTKTDSNPYFVTLRQSAQKEADAKGAKLIALAGKFDGDNEGQVNAIENLIAQGVNGILITPSNSSGVLGAIKQARQKNILVIALDTATEPADAVDATFATDNTDAGRLQGKWAKATLGNTPPKAVMLDGTPGSTVSDQRHNGWLDGFGLKNGAPAVLGTAVTNGEQDKAQSGMENQLQAHPDVNVVYTINEPAARGASQALTSTGKAAGVVMGSIDGGCQGVQDVKDGKIGATVMQFPGKMAAQGVDAVVKYGQDKTKPSGFVNTGAQLITDKPVAGLESKDTAFGLQNCWGK